MINLDSYKLINALQPYGRQFEIPVFESEFTIMKLNRMGTDKQHLKLFLKTDGNKEIIEGVWFNACEDDNCPVSVSDCVRILFALSENTWRGNTKVQLMIKTIR